MRKIVKNTWGKRFCEPREINCRLCFASVLIQIWIKALSRTATTNLASHRGITYMKSIPTVCLQKHTHYPFWLLTGHTWPPVHVPWMMAFGCRKDRQQLGRNILNEIAILPPSCFQKSTYVEYSGSGDSNKAFNYSCIFLPFLCSCFNPLILMNWSQLFIWNATWLLIMIPSAISRATWTNEAFPWTCPFSAWLGLTWHTGLLELMACLSNVAIEGSVGDLLSPCSLFEQ